MEKRINRERNRSLLRHVNLLDVHKTKRSRRFLCGCRSQRRARARPAGGLWREAPQVPARLSAPLTAWCLALPARSGGGSAWRDVAGACPERARQQGWRFLGVGRWEHRPAWGASTVVSAVNFSWAREVRAPGGAAGASQPLLLVSARPGQTSPGASQREGCGRTAGDHAFVAPSEGGSSRLPGPRGWPGPVFLQQVKQQK